MQNKLVILALLGMTNASQSVQVNTKDIRPQQFVQGLPSFGAPSVGGIKTEVHAMEKMKAASREDDAQLTVSKQGIHDMIRGQAKRMETMRPMPMQMESGIRPPDPEVAIEKDNDVEKLVREVQLVGGDSGKKNKAIDMSESDQACYASRYTDLDGKPAKEHYRLTGQVQGRLPHCARDLTDYEAETYLHAFPELQQKFGDGASALKQSRTHWHDTGFTQAHFSETMKDTSLSAWKCGEGAKQSCKCHGTLWYGPTVRPDDKKPVTTWEELRHWKTYEKSSDEWMSCTDAEFGGDPFPDQEKQCWCEDKPAYKPWRCAEEGDECLCNGGWVVYGAKLDASKKLLDFFGTIKLSMAITGTKGKESVTCSATSFDGADPAPDADKACFCDKNKKFFDKSFVKATRGFWKANQLEQSSESELKKTAEHVTEVVRVTKERELSSTESTTSETVENQKALTEVAAAKACYIQSIEEAYKFKKIKITQRRITITKIITRRRTVITQWSFQLNIKTQAQQQSCALAQKKNHPDRARLLSECTRLGREVEDLSTQIQIENEKINQEEKEQLDEINKEENTVEQKRTKETITAEEKADEENNEIKESQSEKELDMVEEKEQLLQQQQELVRIQQKTSHKIDISIKEQQKSINILIRNLRKKLTRMARREQVLVSELSDDAPERETVITKILKRSKETITKLTTVMTSLTTKVTTIKTQITTFRTTITTLTTKLVTIQAKVVTLQETLKLKISERRSKKQILRAYGQKATDTTPSVEGAMVTQKSIDTITTDIKKIRKTLKAQIQSKNEYFSLKVTTQKEIDLFTSRQKVITTQITNLKEFILEVESTITSVEIKIKEEIATKAVVDAQKAAFRASQKLVDSEESLNSKRVVVEKEKAEKTEEAKECKKQFDSDTAELKRQQASFKDMAKTLATAKAKNEITRLTTESINLEKLIADATKALDESTKNCADIDAGLLEIVKESTAQITLITTQIAAAKAAAEAAEKEAKTSIITLPGGKETETTTTDEISTSTTTSTITTTITTTGGGSKTSTGKPKAPTVPAPKPKVDVVTDIIGTTSATGGATTVITTTTSVIDIIKKQEDGVDSDDDEDDGEPSDPLPLEVPGGEQEITDEVIKFTKEAHQKRVDMVKTKETLQYEIRTIRKTVKKYKIEIKKLETTITTFQSEVTTAISHLDSLKTSSIGAIKKVDKQKIEAEISVSTTTITEKQSKLARYQSTIIEWRSKLVTIIERRKQIKYIIEIKVLESKAAEQAVLEAIRTVTDVELVSRKRWIASKTIGDYKKCGKFMAEYKMIYDKQMSVISAEIADHQRRIDVAEGAIASLTEKQTTLTAGGKPGADLDNQLAKIASEIERHTKVSAVETKVIAAVRDKKKQNEKEYQDHVVNCQKLRKKANVAVASVNDQTTTLKNQREYQIQVTNLKNILISSHEEALTKRNEARRIFQNYTTMITHYEQQLTILNEQITESKVRISGSQEIVRILSIRIKEIATLITRTTITVQEKTRLTKEETEIKEKLEVQNNIITSEGKSVATYESNTTTLTTVVTTYKTYITQITTVIKTLEKKVKESKKALKPAGPKKEKPEKPEPPVKGKATDEADAEEKDEDGDDKVDEDEVVDEKPDAVGGGNQKVDKEIEQQEEETTSTVTQLDSLTKTIITTGIKSEKSDTVTTTEVTDTTTEEAELTQLRQRKGRLQRKRQRQRCTRLFPQVFSSFKIKRELTAENMCPCPGTGKGLTQLILDGIEDPGDFDKYVLSLFEKNLAIEGTFQAQMQRYFFNEGDKLVSEETNPVSLRIVAVDDKVDEVLTLLDAQNMHLKSTDVKISPLLKGKSDYMKWQSGNNSANKSPTHVHIQDDEDSEEDDADEQEA